MKHFLSIDHIGYAVRDISETAKHYTTSGWSVSETYIERVQNVQIAFLTKPGFTAIELVSPLDGPSPVDNYLQKEMARPYHICYVVDDIMEAVNDLHAENFMPLFWPVESIAMNNRKICYLYNENVGLIEIVDRD